MSKKSNKNINKSKSDNRANNSEKNYLKKLKTINSLINLTFKNSNVNIFAISITNTNNNSSWDKNNINMDN